MDLIDQIRLLSSRIASQKDLKNVCISPLIEPRER